MIFTLEQVLRLTGELNDTPGDSTPRERFRAFLRENVSSAGELRDFVQECRVKPGLQYARALQDLANHTGTLLGFAVGFGRYAGVPGQIGHDGHWTSPDGLHVIVEVKTSETYPIKVSSLLGYMNELVEAGKVPSIQQALGLFVVAKPDPEVQQVQNSIVAGGHGDRLRLISLESLLTLAELLETHDVAHKDVLSVLRPSTPAVDPLVSLLVRVAGALSGASVAGATGSAGGPPSVPASSSPASVVAGAGSVAVGAGGSSGNVSNNGDSATTSAPGPLTSLSVAPGDLGYHLIPASDTDDASASTCVEILVGEQKVWAFSTKAPGRKNIAAGDHVCFYAAGVGVVADARVSQAPTRGSHPAIDDPQNFPWVMRLDEVRIYTVAPISLDAERRATLEAFEQASDSAKKVWSWFVQSAHRVSPHDFTAITAPKMAAKAS
ncbi:MAG TPA: hypothetical protein VGE02_08290 [Gemmatimonadales bacterium]